MSAATNEAPAPATEMPGANKPSKLPGWVKLIIFGVAGFIVLMIVLVVFVLNFTSGASNAAGQVMDDMLAGNCSDIYQNQTTEYFRTRGTEELWNEECTRIGSILQPPVTQTSVNVQGETGSASVGQVTFEMTGSDEQTYDVTISVEKVGDDWKMDTFNSTAQAGAN